MKFGVVGIALFGLSAGLALVGAGCSGEGRASTGTSGGRSGREVAAPKAGGGAVVFEEEFERIWIEAEAAVKIESDDALAGGGKLMRIAADSGASGGKCVEIPDKAGTPDKDGKLARAAYKFTIKKPGFYVFWCRRKWCDPPQCGDTFAVRFDQEGKPRDLEKEELFGSDDSSRPPRWDWSPVRERGTAKQFFFSAGEHVLEILNREDGPRFDAILLTNDRDYVPQGLEG